MQYKTYMIGHTMVHRTILIHIYSVKSNAIVEKKCMLYKGSLGHNMTYVRLYRHYMPYS